jgi:glycosyltransferase involved in cell wall biosynthesis
MPSLSAITITKNNGVHIGACLDSLAFCDERIVVDSGSTDETVDIARARGAKVSHNDWLGFGPQKNHALTLVCGEWILWVDADETVTPELAAAIRSAIDRGDADGFHISRLSWFCGRPMRHCGWHPDYVMRLFRRGKGRWTTGAGHDHVILDGITKRIPGLILHYPVAGLGDVIKRIDLYSGVGAEDVLAKGRKVRFGTGILRGFWAFIRTYFLQLGFLDGREGFLLSVANAEGTYYRYMRAWMAGRGRG